MIRSSFPSTLPEIQADKQRIKQVLFNLITNAIKFSHDDNPITIKADVLDNEVLIQVSDHGIGIPQADIPAIFNKHYRATNHRDTTGLGLGLHICRQIVEAHGGHIRAESVEGQGSTFSFTLPAASARR